MKRAIAGIIAVLGLSASAPQDSKNAIQWTKTWAEALTEAGARNVPIYLTIHKDACGDCLSVEKGTYPNPVVITAAKNLVCVVAHAGAKVWETNHGSTEIKQGKDKIKMCKIYAGIACADHVEVSKERIAQIFGNKVYATPHHLFYNPKGEELSRSSGTVSPQQLAKDFADALAKVEGTHVAKEDYDKVMVSVREGQAAVKKDEIKKAIAAFQKAAKHENPRLKALADKELEALQVSGEARVEAAIKAMGTSEEDGKKELKKVADEYPPLDCAKKAAEILRVMGEAGR